MISTCRKSDTQWEKKISLIKKHDVFCDFNLLTVSQWVLFAMSETDSVEEEVTQQHIKETKGGEITLLCDNSCMWMWHQLSWFVLFFCQLKQTWRRGLPDSVDVSLSVRHLHMCVRAHTWTPPHIHTPAHPHTTQTYTSLLVSILTSLSEIYTIPDHSKC